MNDNDISRFEKTAYQLLKNDENWDFNYRFDIKNNTLIGSYSTYLSKNSSINYFDFNVEKEKMRNYIKKILDDKDCYEVSGIIREDYLIHYNIHKDSRKFDDIMTIHNLIVKFTLDYRIIVQMQLIEGDKNELISYTFELFYFPLNIDLNTFEIVSS